MAPGNRDTLRVGEGMLAILLAGGIAPQTAAWAMDALSLYVAAYALERSMGRAAPGGQRRRVGAEPRRADGPAHGAAGRCVSADPTARRRADGR
ncbi:hypothetical protein GCM10020218_045800 [Dactylosporangium vinaceum]